MRVHLAVDAMSGDFGPRVTLPAALRALQIHPQLTVTLVGNRQTLQPVLERYDADGRLPPRLAVEDARRTLPMDAQPRDILRDAQDSSLHVALQMLREARVDGVVSAGSTAALLALGRRHISMLPGFSRPALCSGMPLQAGFRYMMDLGANVDCDADSLLEFAYLGTALINVLEGRESPRVVLLSNGTEANKGNLAIREAAKRMAADPWLNFCGYIEADALHLEGPELVICDGMLGNIAIKSAEGTAQLAARLIADSFSRHWWLRLLAGIAAPALGGLRGALSADRHGGAFLLGLQGVVVKSHGGSNSEAFCSALDQAARCIENGMVEKLARHLDEQPQRQADTEEDSNRDN